MKMQNIEENEAVTAITECIAADENSSFIIL
jgi:hypothetical protein